MDYLTEEHSIPGRGTSQGTGPERWAAQCAEGMARRAETEQHKQKKGEDEMQFLERKRRWGEL